MKEFAEILKSELLKGLPGTEIQWQMASSDRMIRNFPGTPGKEARIASVLILLYPHNGLIHTVFIQRPDYNGVHGGQISFPGGKQDPDDENIIQTAVREANEEIGVDASEIEIIGMLTPLFIPVSNMLVTPVVGWASERPEFEPEAEEVVFIFDAELKRFIDTSTVKIKPMQIKGEMIEVKYFDYDGNVIWGATAMILNELLTILGRIDIFVR
jgi:8-oxo-dGTP pyrophosphatase MutT (NUDIX family)